MNDEKTVDKTASSGSSQPVCSVTKEVATKPSSGIPLECLVMPSELRLLYHAQPVLIFFHDSLFVAGDGEEVWEGDIVEFDMDGEISPISGTVCNYNGLKIACFNTSLNKWEYYGIEV